MNLKKFKVHVYRHEYERTKGGKGSITNAYTRYATPGGCVHEVEGVNGSHAKTLAIAEHREKCGNRLTNSEVRKGQDA